MFLGAVGGPRWDDPAPVRPEQGLLGMRSALGLYANLRPARHMRLPTALREDVVRQADLLVVRELSGGVYFGEPRGIGGDGVAINPVRHTAEEVRRVAKVAFEQAAAPAGEGDLGGQGQRAGDLAPVADGDEEVAQRLSRGRAGAPLRGRLSFEMIQAPQRFDVMVTENIFGDILPTRWA